MDHARLILAFVVAATAAACSSHEEIQTRIPPRTVLQSNLKPATAEILSEQFLEWQKGYNIRIRDHAQGLLVTEWASDNPFDRHRITLRVSEDIAGSLLTAHIVRELYDQGRWLEVPSTGQNESMLLAELEQYLEKSKRRGPN